MKRTFAFLLVSISTFGFAQEGSQLLKSTSIIVLGNVQDAGSPQIACKKECCSTLFENPDPTRKVVSLGVVDPINNKKYLFEATPDIGSQIRSLSNYTEGSEIPNGIFLTHAHIGHYTGLMYLGKEALNASQVDVFAMPKMSQFLSENGPWDQLVSKNNIELQEQENKESMKLTSELSVEPFLVPHREEYSETVGYKVTGPNKSALFIPDIDKWEKWETSIIDELKKVDYAFLDAAFYDAEEINHRDISEIPHPFVIESMKLFDQLPREEKQKVWFIHMNHTNPLLDPESDQSKVVESKGYNVARFGDVFDL